MMDASNATLTSTNTHVEDSYLLKTKDEIRDYLLMLRELGQGQMAVNLRDLESQVCEWRSHNFFYLIHVFRSRTKDVDLELKQAWWREMFCRVVSFFYFW